MTNGLLLGMYSSRGGREEHTATGALIHHLIYAVRYLGTGAASLMARREHLHDAGIAGDDSGLVAQDVELARGVPREAEDRDARIHHQVADTVGHVGRGAHVEEATLGLAEDARVVAEDILPGECRHPRSPVDEAADDRLTPVSYTHLTL